MYPSRPPVRRHSPQVYQVRRAIVASAAVLVLFAIYQVVGGGGGGDQPTELVAASSTTSTTAVPDAPPCVEGDSIIQEDPKTAWATLIVDTERALPSTYGPGDLHNISAAGFPFTEGVALRGFVMEDLSRLREKAAENGTPIKVIVGYRSYVTQIDLFERRVDEFGSSEAGSRVARPGHSEHQLGTTIDITSEGMNDVDQSWGATPTGQWIASNAYKYGFILSYPPDGQSSTCYDYEPWHLRYVGPDQAAQVIASGLTLRQYLYSLGVNAPAIPSSTTTPRATTG